MGRTAECAGKLPELVASELQELELAELADRVGQVLEAVVLKTQVLEVSRIKRGWMERRRGGEHGPSGDMKHA